MIPDYDQFFRATYPRLVAMAVATGAPRAEAQELAQEALLRAHRRWDTVGAYDAPLAWCRRVLGNLLIDRHRSARAERSALATLGDAATGSADADGDPQTRSETPPWDDLVRSLTDRQRLAVTLYYGEDLTVGEVAEVMAVSTGTVKSALAKARRNVERTLDRDDRRSRRGPRTATPADGEPSTPVGRRHDVVERVLRRLAVAPIALDRSWS